MLWLARLASVGKPGLTTAARAGLRINPIIFQGCAKPFHPYIAAQYRGRLPP
jgi:hypothetical protein